MTGYVDIAIDPMTNDIAHEDGLIGYVNMAEETVQRIRTCLRRIQGEWFLDETAGLPYFGGSMLGGKDLEYVKLIIRQEIAQRTGVKNINEINAILDITTRKVSVYVSITIDEQVYKITEELQ